LKILFIAPLPPPITGHSLVSEFLVNFLKQNDDVKIVNLSKENIDQSSGGIKRIFQVFNILFQIYKEKKNIDVIYFTISESFAGNLKDLLIYLICFNKLNKIFIHLHGGSIKKLLWDKNNFIFNLNKFFIKKLSGVIISGNSHLEIFDGLIANSKIKIVPNFAQESLFISESDLKLKFTTINPLRLLYIGGLIEKKGYLELTRAFIELPYEIKSKFVLHIAGKFESKSAELNFHDLIKNIEGVTYHGIIDEATKKSLLHSAHVFCLPTSFLEGQPISILEAYASGCFVLTTPQPGILDIFKNNLNGFCISERSVLSVKDALIMVLNRSSEIENIANNNLLVACDNYKLDKYVNSIRSFLSFKK
jgi:glycosyltransferase involved in cell wall biosynthesis